MGQLDLPFGLPISERDDAKMPVSLPLSRRHRNQIPNCELVHTRLRSFGTENTDRAEGML